MRYIHFLFLATCAMVAAAEFIGDSSCAAQTLQPNQWQTYTSMRSATDVALSSDSLHAWVATGGGAFEVDLRFPDSTPRSLRTTDGLSQNGLTAVAADDSGNVYFGGANGGFDVYHIASGTINQLGVDIQNSSFTNKGINGISVFGDNVYLATSYGLTVYNARLAAFGATATQIAGLPAEDSVQQLLDDGTNVYAAMAEGVAVARDNRDLHNGANWTLLADPDGAVRSLARYHGTIYAGARNGIFIVSTAQHTLIPVPNAPLSINRLIVAHDSLIILDESGTVFTTSDLQTFTKQSLNVGSTIVSVAPDTLGGLVVATNANGIAFPSGDSRLTNIFPPGPIISATQSLYFSSSTGELYITHLGAGFDVFHPATGTWNDFEAGVGSTPKANYLNPLYDSVRNILWISTIGNPLYRVGSLESDTPVWNAIDASQIAPWDQSGYLRSAGLMIDRDGNIVVTSWSGNGKGLSISSDGFHFTQYLLEPSTPQAWEDVTQDLDGNYWVGTENNGIPPPVGVGWLRKSDEAAGYLRGGQGGSFGASAAGTENVSSLITDQDGAVWCGTYAGVEIISNPYAIEQNAANYSIRSVPFVANQIVHAIAVDGVGNKWIGTENGIFVVSPDGADSIARYTKENSPLVDDYVKTIAIDPNRGEVYAGTPSGISRFSTIFKQGNPNYSNVHVYPNPVVETSEGSPNVYIDGLVAGSTVQIFSLGGRLITTINGTSLGSTVKWNGLDALGRVVPSGMYLISATSPQTGENGEAKVVIVRKP